MLDAVEEGDLARVKRLLKKDATRINNQDEHGWTPLYIASRDGYLDIVKCLIKNGARIDEATNNDGPTPLLLASKNGHVNVVEFLVSQGTSVNQATNYGTTALHVASGAGRLNVVTFLLSQGAIIDQVSHRGDTSLHRASWMGHLEVVRALVDAGASLDLVNKEGHTAMDIATKYGYSTISFYLDENEKTQLREASETGLKQNPPTTMEPFDGDRPLATVDALPPQENTPFSSLEELCKYIASHPPSTTWPLQGNYVMNSNTIGQSNHAVFQAANTKRQRISMAAKLTHSTEELEFIATIVNRIGHEKYVVDCFDWDCVVVAGFDCNVIIMECGRGNCCDQLRQLQSDRFLRLRCVEHVALAVDFLHGNNYIHGDLKLENVVDFGQFKLIDFDHTVPMGTILPPHCTRQYCPPELAHYLRCQGPAVAASSTFDIWCLGVLVLKLFVPGGELVEFNGLSDDAILDAIAAPGFSFQASLLAADLSGRQRWYLSKCLEPNPAKRATSATTILKMVDMKSSVTTAVVV
ncbi:hypothetical protein As57867_018863, partial [Aphanomyces stellatus]